MYHFNECTLIFSSKIKIRVIDETNSTVGITFITVKYNSNVMVTIYACLCTRSTFFTGWAVVFALIGVKCCIGSNFAFS